MCAEICKAHLGWSGWMHLEGAYSTCSVTFWILLSQGCGGWVFCFLTSSKITHWISANMVAHLGHMTLQHILEGGRQGIERINKVKRKCGKGYNRQGRGPMRSIIQSFFPWLFCLVLWSNSELFWGMPVMLPKLHPRSPKSWKLEPSLPT